MGISSKFSRNKNADSDSIESKKPQLQNIKTNLTQEAPSNEIKSRPKPIDPSEYNNSERKTQLLIEVIHEMIRNCGPTGKEVELGPSDKDDLFEEATKLIVQYQQG